MIAYKYRCKCGNKGAITANNEIKALQCPNPECRKFVYFEKINNSNDWNQYKHEVFL